MMDCLAFFFEIKICRFAFVTYSEIFTVTVRVVFGGDYLSDHIFSFLSIVVY